MAMDAASPLPAAEPIERHLHGAVLIGALSALMLTLLLEALDQTIVGTAMPRIIGQLRGLDRYSWAVTAYILASTTLIPFAGKLSDQFGRKLFLFGGTVIFLLGSALCGLAQTIDQLIVFRALQGAGAGIGIALIFTAVGDLFPPVERGKWQGVVGSVYAISSVLGPTLGGWLADHGPLLGPLIVDAARWRWVFFINLPLGGIALTLLLVFLPADRPAHSGERMARSARHIDVPGAIVGAAATLCLLLGLTWGGEGTSWGEPRVVGSLAGAVICYAALLVIERRAVEPIVPLALFRNRIYAANAILSVLLSMTLFGTAFYVPLYLQGVLGVSATQSGATMTPFSVSIALAGSIAGMAISALKRHQPVAIAGALLMTAGVFALTRMTPTTDLVHAALYVALAGLGMGALFSVVGIVALNAVPPTQMGIGSAAVRYLGQIGGAIGVAVVGAVVNVSLADELGHRIPAAAARRLAADGVALAGNPQALVSPAYRAALTRAAVEAARGRIAPGPHHTQLVAAATRQAQHLLIQAFDALRLALAAAIQHGLLAALICSGAAILAACFVADVPTVQQSDAKAGRETHGSERASDLAL